MISGQNATVARANFHPEMNAMTKETTNVVVHWKNVATLSPMPSYIKCISLEKKNPEIIVKVWDGKNNEGPDQDSTCNPLILWSGALLSY